MPFSLIIGYFTSLYFTLHYAAVATIPIQLELRHGTPAEFLVNPTDVALFINPEQ